jgi:hypothetical protein
MNAAAVVRGQKSAGAIGAGANAVITAPARHRLEGIPISPFAAGIVFTKPSRRIALHIPVALGVGNQHVPAAATTAALGAGEALLGIDAEGHGVVV